MPTGRRSTPASCVVRERVFVPIEDAAADEAEAERHRECVRRLEHVRKTVVIKDVLIAEDERHHRIDEQKWPEALGNLRQWIEDRREVKRQLEQGHHQLLQGAIEDVEARKD